MDLPDKVRASEDPRTPEDERHDLNAELFNEFKSDLAIVPRETLLELHQEFLASDLNKAVPTFAAWQRPYPKYKRDRHKSYLYIDELGIAAGGAMQPWVEKNTYAFEVLKAMVEHTSILNAVIVTRIRQIQPFLRPHQRHAEHPMGFEIRPKGKGLSDKLTEDEKKISDDIQCFLLNCGDEQDPRKRDWICRRSNLSTFMAKSIRDTLTMDACPIETEMTRNGKQLSGLYAIPGETIRLAHEEGYSGDDEIIAVQIYEDQVVTYYEPSELIYPIRNPRTDILASRYGYAETEQFVRIVTGFLNALNYNMAGFDRNNIPRGFLTMFGNFDQNQLNDFKRRWTSLLNGASRRWAFPVMASREKDAGATWTPIDVNFDEMHFAKWMSFLVSIICAIYSIGPEEINFDSFTSRQSTPLGGEDTSERLAASRDKGLEPLIAWYEGLFNEYVIPLVHADYELRFVGLHSEDEEWLRSMKEKTSTYNEMRKLRGEDEFEDKVLGEAPMDPKLLPLYMQQLPQEETENIGEEEQHGIPQEYLDRLKDGNQGPGGRTGGPEEIVPRKENPVAAGKEALDEAARDIEKATRSFVVYSNIEDDSKKPAPEDDGYENWTW